MSDVRSNILRLGFSAVPVGTNVEKLMEITAEYPYFPVEFAASAEGANWLSNEFWLLDNISVLAEKMNMPLVSCAVLIKEDFLRNINFTDFTDYYWASGDTLGQISSLDRVVLFPTDAKFGDTIYEFAASCKEQFNISTTLAANRNTFDAVKAIAKTPRLESVRAVPRNMKIPFPYEIEHIGDLMDKNGIVLNYWRDFSDENFTHSFGGGIKSSNIYHILTNIVDQQPMHKHTRLSVGSAVLDKDGKFNFDEFRNILQSAEEWMFDRCNRQSRSSKAARSNMDHEIMTPDEYLSGLEKELCESGGVNTNYVQPSLPFNLQRNKKVFAMAMEIMERYR